MKKQIHVSTKNRNLYVVVIVLLVAIIIFLKFRQRNPFDSCYEKCILLGSEKNWHGECDPGFHMKDGKCYVDEGRCITTCSNVK